jgi:capsular polysaccharide biosynthesis protein
MDNQQYQQTLAMYLAILRRWWLALLLVPLVGAGSAYWLSTQREPAYSASTTLFIRHASPTSADVTAAKLLAKTYSQLVTSQPVLERVRTELGVAESPSALASQIKAIAVPDTQIIEITVENRDPQMAATIANTLGAAFTAWIEEQQEQTWNQTKDPLQAVLDQMLVDIEQTTVELATLRAPSPRPTLEQQSQIALLEARLTQYQSNYRNLITLQQKTVFEPQSRVLITSPAEPPQVANTPPPLQIAALALALCFGLVITAIILLERFAGRPLVAVSSQPMPAEEPDRPFTSGPVLTAVPEHGAD